MGNYKTMKGSFKIFLLWPVSLNAYVIFYVPYVINYSFTNLILLSVDKYSLSENTQLLN